MTGLWRRVFRLPTRERSVEREVDDELAFHLESRVQELVERGMERNDAQRAAAREFGDVRAAHEELASIDRRRLGRRERAEWWADLRQDVRFAVRTLASNRVFTTAALLTLALGIGATTAIFSVVNGVLLSPLPYPNHDRLQLLWTTMRLGGEPQNGIPYSAGNYYAARERLRSFESLAAFRAWGFTIGDGDEPEIVPGVRTSPELFHVIGVRPLLGRDFAPDDDRPGAPPVAVLGWGLWQRKYGGRRDIVGSRITLNGEPATVIGVMPPGFDFPRGAELPSGFQIAPRTDIWTPLALSEERRRDYGTGNLVVAGLLRRDVTAEQAALELRSVMRDIGDEIGASQYSFGGEIIPMREQSVRDVRAGLWLLFAAAGLVLLIACANVSNLLVARATGRRREMAIRAALGAGRGRLVRQMITENVLLALAGGGLGLLVALGLERSLLALAPPGLPRLEDVKIDGRVLLAALGTAGAAGAAFGLVAAVHSARAGAAAGLREGGRGHATRSRSRSVFVVLEVAVSLVLLVGAALLTRSFARMQRVDAGFRPSNVLTAGLVMRRDPGRTLAEQATGWRNVTEPFQERIRALPGVIEAGGVSSLPLTGAWESTTFNIDGRPAAAPDARPRADYAVALPGYFRALGIPVLRGRAFTEQDRADGPRVVLVSRVLAERYWKDEDPIGAQILVFDATPLTVVGVVEDVRSHSLIDPPQPTLYFPYSQFAYPFMVLVVRTAGDPVALAPALRRELRAVDPTVALTEIRSMQEVFDASLAQRRFAMLIVGFFAGSALVLAAVGLYGVIAYAVSQRTREIGIRLALGARAADVRRMVLRDGLALTAIGLGIGLAGALAAARVLRGQLFEVSPVDPAVYALIVVVLVVTALVASWAPARRATRVDPVTALREE
jgi:predicted permease